ncbi:MAG: hypothetical protein IJD04_00855, partial [Desulfovibrionaceae bacterium]|nr:hypothetical protein [Desulfovibrionaceae bacterium]
HVFFAPRAHSRDACNECHTFSETEYLDIFKLKRGDEKAEAGKIFYQTAPMRMDECMSCHAVAAHEAATTASESCGSCHR